MNNKNILSEKFYKKLIANGPPETLYYGDTFKKLYQSSDETIKELLIADEIAYGYTQYDWNNLMEYIENPSILVTISAIFKNPKYFHTIINPTRSQIIAYLAVAQKEIENYLPSLTTEDEFELLRINPTSIAYLLQTEKKCLFVIQSIINPQNEYDNFAYQRMLLLGIKESRRCSYFDKIKLFSDRIDYDRISVLKLIKYWTDEMCELIMSNRSTSQYLYLLPEHYQTEERIKIIFDQSPSSFPNYNLDQIDAGTIEKYIKHNPSYIKTVPHNKQTDTIIEMVINCRYADIKYLKPLSLGKILSHFSSRPEVCSLLPQEEWTQDLAINFFDEDPTIFKSIPPNFMNYDMCLKAVRHDKYNLDFCPIINEQMLNDVLAIIKTKHEPKNTRWNFINCFKESTLVKIVTVNPNLLFAINKHYQTDAVIRATLTVNGYCLQYVLHKTDEYETMAINQQPRAIIYTRGYSK